MPHMTCKQSRTPGLNATLSTFLAFFVAAAYVRANEAVYGSFSEAISGRPELAIVDWLLYRANLAGVLSDPSAVSGTAFLPTNEAIDQFVRGQGFSNIGNMLNQRQELTRLMWYHLSEDSVNVTDLLYGTGRFRTNSVRYSYTATGLPSLSGLSSRALTLRAVRGNMSSIRVLSSDGASANANVVDIVSVAKNSLIFIIDAVLPYWYNTVAEVLGLTSLSSNPANQFLRGLTAANLLTQMGDAAASYTLFVPTQTAFDIAYSYYGADVLNANLQDLVKYHIVPGPTVLKFRAAHNMSLTSIRVTDSYNTLTVTGSESGLDVLANLAVTGRDMHASVLRVFFVGGFNTRSCVYLIDRVLFPVYSTVNSYLNRPGSEFSLLASMFGGAAYQPDIHPRQNATFLAPDDRALTSYANDWGVLTAINSSSQQLSIFLRNHVLMPSMPGNTWRDGMKVTTQAREAINVHVAEDGEVVLIGTRSSARVRTGAQAVPILFATSWVLPIDYVLLPSALNLTALPIGGIPTSNTGGSGGGGGSAAAAAPSMWLVAAGAVLATAALQQLLLVQR